MTAAARPPPAIVWRGDLELPPEEQCVKFLGTPLGHSSFVRSQLATLSAETRSVDQQNFCTSRICSAHGFCCCIALRLARITLCGWFIQSCQLLLQPNTEQHDAALRRALSQFVSVPPRSTFWDVASLPFTMGGMGLHSAVLTSGAAYWSSWGDCLEMIAARNPSVADMIVTQIDHEDAGFHVSGAAQVRDQFVRAGFDVPNWQALRAGLRPPGQQVDERQVGIPGHGWQHETTQAVHAHLMATTIWPRLAPEERALIRSQGGPMSGVLFTCFPVSREDRVFVVSGVGASSSMASFTPFPPATAGVAFHLTSVATTEQLAHRLGCWVAGALPSSQGVHKRDARDLDLLPQDRPDTRRLEVVADGLPLPPWGPVAHRHHHGVSSPHGA